MVTPVKLLHMTTVPMTLMFMRGQVDFMRAKGFELALLSSPGSTLDHFAEEYHLPAYGVPMERRVTPGRDLLSLVELVRILRRERPTILHAHTPKAGLLGMVAAFLARVPVRIYHLRGLPLATAEGSTRLLLRLAEKTAALLAHRVLAVSASLRRAAAEAGVCRAKKIEVLAGGSGNGVDAHERFNPARFTAEDRLAARRRWGVPDDAVVIGFVGRLTRDKGLLELATAFRVLAHTNPRLRMVIVGPEEKREPVPEKSLESLQRDHRVHFTGMLDDAAVAYLAMDILVLPTYREGFPNVILEAGAMELPVVATAVTGCVDAVVDGVTGRLVPARHAAALTAAIAAYIEQPELAREHGKNGRERVLKDFRQEVIWQELESFYRRMLEARGLERTA